MGSVGDLGNVFSANEKRPEAYEVRSRGMCVCADGGHCRMDVHGCPALSEAPAHSLSIAEGLCSLSVRCALL